MGSNVPLFRIQDLTVRFGGLTAVDGVSFVVNEGEFAGVIGPNGAGKTTFIDAVSGLVPSTGSVEFDGVVISNKAPHKRKQAGLGRTFQSLELFEDLTVRENILCAAEPERWWSTLRDLVKSKPARAALESAEYAIEQLGIQGLENALPSDLSLGQRKLVTIARALAGRPRMLLLDEPAAGLDSEESIQLGHELKVLVDSGIAILMVEHDMNLVLGFCETVKVLEFGALIADGPPEEIRNNEQVMKAYLGAPESLGGEE